MQLILQTDYKRYPQANDIKLHASHFPCQTSFPLSLATDLSLDKVQCIFLSHDINTTVLVDVTDTIALFRYE
jgi:hypothetical protein